MLFIYFLTILRTVNSYQGEGWVRIRWFSGGTELGISCRQQSIEWNYRKLTANGVGWGSRQFYRDILLLRANENSKKRGKTQA